ncbi:MAG: hypothetical protein U5N86_13655 [Planctomycetota bacterium]|nr:hypothetical protein [Planctomycetota bacterium]
MAFEVSFKLDWKLLGVYAACLAVLLFAVLVYRNHQVLVVQRAELERLAEVERRVSWERRSLEARRNSLSRREPFFTRCH